MLFIEIRAHCHQIPPDLEKERLLTLRKNSIEQCLSSLLQFKVKQEISPTLSGPESSEHTNTSHRCADQINVMLDYLNFIESLYPSRLALAESTTLYFSPKVVKTVESLASWINIHYGAAHKMNHFLNFEKILNIDEMSLDCVNRLSTMYVDNVSKNYVYQAKLLMSDYEDNYKDMNIPPVSENLYDLILKPMGIIIRVLEASIFKYK